jgi:Ser/Thr protein kinase RdoA (MazF antagonist)
MDGEEAARAFGLGRPLSDPTNAASGLMGTIWQLRTDRGQYALKEVWHPLDESTAAASDAFTRRLIDRGVPAPRPLQTIQGTTLARIGTSTVRASEWVELREVDPDRELDAVGRLLALMHREPIRAAGPVDFWYTHPVEPPEWQATAKALQDARAPFATEFAASVPHFLDLQPLFRAPRDKQVCHRDLWPDNLKATAHGLCVIDWDNAGPAEATQELAMVIVGFWQGDPHRARSLYDAYCDAGGPGRIVEPGDFTMVLAQFGHFAVTAARRWMNTASPHEKDLYHAWFQEGWDQPFGMPQIAGLLQSLN